MFYGSISYSQAPPNLASSEGGGVLSGKLKNPLCADGWKLQKPGLVFLRNGMSLCFPAKA